MGSIIRSQQGRRQFSLTVRALGSSSAALCCDIIWFPFQSYDHSRFATQVSLTSLELLTSSCPHTTATSLPILTAGF